MTVRKHLTLSQRIIIENGLLQGKKIAKIAREAKVSRSTVVRVIKVYRYDKLEWSCRFGGQNWCVRHRECGLLDHKDAQSVNDAVARIHAAFFDVQHPMVFGILLGDEEEIARKAVEKFRMTRGERTACHVSDRT